MCVCVDEDVCVAEGRFLCVWLFASLRTVRVRLHVCECVFARKNVCVCVCPPPSPPSQAIRESVSPQSTSSAVLPRVSPLGEQPAGDPPTADPRSRRPRPRALRASTASDDDATPRHRRRTRLRAEVASVYSDNPTPAGARVGTKAHLLRRARGVAGSQKDVKHPVPATPSVVVGACAFVCVRECA